MNKIRFSNHSKRKLQVRTRYFFNSLFKQALLMLLPLIFICVISTSYLYSQARESVSQDNNQNLYQLNAIMDSNFSVMDNVYLYLITNSTVNSALRKAYNEDVLSLQSIRMCENVGNIFSNYIYANKYIYDLKIYYDNQKNRVLSLQKHEIIDARLLRDQEWIARYSEMKESSFLEGVTLPATSTESEKRIMRQYRKIYSSLNGNNAVGCIIIDYDLDKFDQYIRSSGFSDDQAILFTDKNGNIVYSSNNTDYSALAANLDTGDASDQFSSKMITFNNSKLFVSVFHSSRTDGLNYISITPASIIFHSANRIFTLYAIFVCIAIILSTLLAYYKTRRDFSHLNSIFDIFENPKQILQKPEKRSVNRKSPYDMILDNLIHLFIQQNYLDILNKEQKSRIQVLEMTALQQQINPHFLNNTLNTIYWSAIRLTGSENNCSQMIADLSSMMRYLLGNPQEIVPISAELEYLKEFLRIQSIRYQNNLAVTYNIDNSVLAYQIHKIIIQPIVENALHHGIKPKDGKGTITISIKEKDKYLNFCIADDGVGMASEQLNNLKSKLSSEDDYGPHIGLSNVNRRLILSYGQESSLQIESILGQGTTVSFAIQKDLCDKAISV